MSEQVEVLGILGHPLSHSASPDWHQARLDRLPRSYRYLCFDIESGDLAGALKGLHRVGVKGLNVTVPYKEAVFELVEDVDEEASTFGAVNCLRWAANGYQATNTDALGFIDDLTVQGGRQLSGARVLVVGCGGAGRTLALALARANAREVVLWNRTKTRLEAVAQEIEAHYPHVQVEPCFGEGSRNVDELVDVVVLATTPLPSDSLDWLDPNCWSERAVLCDLNYYAPHPIRSRIAEAGRDYRNGWGMFEAQARRSWAFWFGHEPPAP